MDQRRRSVGRQVLDASSVAVIAICLATARVCSGSNNNNGDNVGYHNVQAFCRRSYIQVTGLWITCDTPGAYYYGSSAYRNSEVCMSGDKANLEVDFVIPSGWDGTAIALEIQSGLYNHFETVVSTYSMCQDLTITQTYDSSANECPNPGYFTLSTYYTVPSIPDYDFHYTPDIKLIFSSAADGSRLGCATTGTVAMHRVADRKATHGLVALGLSVVTFCFVFGLLLYLSYRRKRRLEQVLEQRKQQYQYFRTLPSGQVVPLPGAKKTLATVREAPSPEVSMESHSAHSRDGGETNAMNISNPSYNETQIPTRPII